MSKEVKTAAKTNAAVLTYTRVYADGTQFPVTHANKGGKVDKLTAVLRAEEAAARAVGARITNAKIN
jgi:hypothetical protein